MADTEISSETEMFSENLEMNISTIKATSLEEMSTTDESMNATTDEPQDTSWEATKLMLTATINKNNATETMNQISNSTANNSLNNNQEMLTVAATSSMMTESAIAAASLNNGDKPHKCDTCDKAFSLRRALKAHKRVHTGEKPFKCDTCPKAFSHQGALKAHKRVHTGERPFKCDVCDMSFSHRSTLITHRRTHTGEKPFKCDLCDEVFSYRQTMKSHRKKHTLANANGTTNSTSTHTVKRLRCNTCHLEFGSKEEVETHIIEIHLEKKVLKCLTCNKTFSNCDSLEKHKLTHLSANTSVSRSVTGGGVSSSVSGNNAGADASCGDDSSGDHSLSFPPVSKQQRSSNNLATNRIHIEERPYKCCICNEGFPSMTALTNHEKTHNDDASMTLLAPSSLLLSSYTCDICGVVFSQKSYLDIHKKTHVQEKPFEYNSTAVASQKDYSDSPFECTICGALFTNNMWSSSA